MGAGSNIPLHHMLRYKKDNKFYVGVIVWGIEHHRLQFFVANDGQTLECKYTPLTTAAQFFVDPETSIGHPEHDSIVQYFANSTSKTYKYLVHFPEAVNSSYSSRPILRTIKVAGADENKDQHRINAIQPVAYTLTFLVSGQQSEDVAFGMWGLE
ncbi:hypothetical protein BDR26DRAFT_932888 [Obelidium mucronatum]|nr:hypothetical protein BDR26DRAFT_932888 [Obelidium mucronatum]